MTKIGRHLERDLKSLVEEVVSAALKEAGMDKSQLLVKDISHLFWLQGSSSLFMQKSDRFLQLVASRF